MISRTQGGYRFAGHRVLVDTARLAELVAEADAAEEAADLAAAVLACAEAVGLFRGEPLAGLPGPFADSERLRLTERGVALSQCKGELQLPLGRHAEAAAELSAVLAANPLREPLAALLMRAHYAANRRSDALTVFRRTLDRLRSDLGVEPGEELRRTHHAVLREDDAFLLGHRDPAGGGRRSDAGPGGRVP